MKWTQDRIDHFTDTPENTFRAIGFKPMKTNMPAMKKITNPAIAAELKIEKYAALVGNMGLYAVCYELARRGWNVMPTSRNARGVDIVGYDQKGKRTITVQVKALSKAVPVPLGTDPLMGNLIAEFIIIARGVKKEPVFFIAKAEDVRKRFGTEEGEKDGFHTGVSKKTGKTSCWLQPKGYEPFKEKWDIIGEGW